MSKSGFDPAAREAATFDRHTIAEIQRAATEGMYDIRGFGAKRRLPHFDDLLFLGASISRYPLEGYRERCGTDVTRSEEHTSELQSLAYLVCRLLLEKKKNRSSVTILAP